MALTVPGLVVVILSVFVAIWWWRTRTVRAVVAQARAGEAAFNENRLDEARTHFEQALALTASIRDLDLQDQAQIDVRRSLSAIAMLQERYADATSLLDKLIRQVESYYGADSRRLLDHYGLLGVAQLELDEHQEAEDTFEKLLNLSNDFYDREVLNVVSSLRSTAEECNGRRFFRWPPLLHAQALRVLTEASLGETQEAARTRIDQASAHLTLLEVSKAAAVASEVSDFFSADDSETNTLLFADYCFLVGQVALARGVLSDAEENMQRCLEIRHDRLGRNDVRTALAAGILGTICREKGDYHRAERYGLAGLEYADSVGDAAKASRVLTRAMLACSYLTVGRYDDAAALLRAGLELAEELGRAGDAVLGFVYIVEARLQIDVKRFEEAEARLIAAQDLLVKLHGPDHLFVAMEIVGWFGWLDYCRGHIQQAEISLHEALRDLESSTEDLPLVEAQLLAMIADLHLELGRFEEARAACSRGQQLLQGRVDADHVTLAAINYVLGRVQHALGNLSEAESYFQSALAARERVLVSKHPHLAESLAAYAKLLRELQRESEAVVMETRAVAIRANYN